MIGNDVIDLQVAAAESDWRRKGFLEKLFSEVEIRLILESENPETSVWHLWSRKEAAYKIFNRKTGIRAFNPKHFHCRDLNDSGIVVFGDSKVYSKTEITSQYIHTICVEDRNDWNKIASLSESQIIKKDNLPFVYQNNGYFPATVSHHGRFEFRFGLFENGLDRNLSL